MYNVNVIFQADKIKYDKNVTVLADKVHSINMTNHFNLEIEKLNSESTDLNNQSRNAQKDITNNSIKLTDQLKPVPTRSSDYPPRSQLPNSNFVSKPTDVRKLSLDEITEPTSSDLTPKTPFSLEQKNKYSPLAKTDAETSGKLNFDPKTNQNIRKYKFNVRNRWQTKQIIENAM